MNKPIFVAVWHHRHGCDTFVNKTEKGRLKDVVKKVCLEYLSELDPDEADAVESLAKKGKYDDALRVWGDCKQDEYVDFYTSYLGN
jgi:hypothetical protein